MSHQQSPAQSRIVQAWRCLLLVLMGTIWGLQFAMLKLAAEAGHSEIDLVTAALALISIFFGGLVILRGGFFRPSRDVLVFLIVTGLLGYVAPLVAILYAAPHVSAGVLVSFGTFVLLIAGVLWGILLFSETHGAAVWIAAVLILGALALIASDRIVVRRHP